MGIFLTYGTDNFFAKLVFVELKRDWARLNEVYS